MIELITPINILIGAIILFSFASIGFMILIVLMRIESNKWKELEEKTDEESKKWDELIDEIDEIDKKWNEINEKHNN